MIIASGRSNTPSLNNGIHHSLLNRTILKLATRITIPSQIQIAHTKPSKFNESIQSKPKGTQSPIQPNV